MCLMVKAGFTMAIRPMGRGIPHGAHGFFSLGQGDRVMTVPLKNALYSELREEL